MYKPHPKQIEFFESEERYVFWGGAYPNRAGSELWRKLMAYEGNPYPSEDAIAVPSLKGGQVMLRRSKMERLNDAKRGLEAKLAEVNKAIELLEKHPEMNELIEALERAGI